MYYVEVVKYLKGKPTVHDSFPIESMEIFDARMLEAKKQFSEFFLDHDELITHIHDRDYSVCVVTPMVQEVPNRFGNTEEYTGFILDNDRGNSKILATLKGCN